MGSLSPRSGPQGKLDHTGLLMLVTLKVVSMCQNYSDGLALGDKAAGEHPRAFSTRPSLLQALGFCTLMHNNLVGPHMEYKAYLDFCEGTGAHAEAGAHGMRTRSKGAAGAGDAPDFKTRLARSRAWYFLATLARFVVFMGAYVHVGDLFPLRAMYGEGPGAAAYAAYPIWRKTAHGVGFILCNTQTKYFAMWSLAELGMIAGGLSKWTGADGTTRWDLFSNFDFLKLNTASSARQMPSYWNVHTGHWLRYYSYERIFLDKGGKPTTASLFGTQIVSALWHGLAPGYLWFFVTTALFFEAGKVLYKYSVAAENGLARGSLVALNYVLPHVMIGQGGPPFMALSWDRTASLVRGFGASGQLLCVAVIVLGAVFPPKKKRGAGSGSEKKGR